VTFYGYLRFPRTSSSNLSRRFLSSPLLSPFQLLLSHFQCPRFAPRVALPTSDTSADLVCAVYHRLSRPRMYVLPFPLLNSPSQIPSHTSPHPISRQMKPNLILEKRKAETRHRQMKCALRCSMY
jgi:hypothetical protein